MSAPSSNVRARPALFVAAVALLACTADEPRPQLVVHVDTDLPVVEQMAGHPELSFDAAIDAVRVEAVGARDAPRTFIVPDPQDWPFTFGVEAPEGTKKVRLRLTAARSTLVREDDPTSFQPQVAVDRIVDLDLPESGIHDVRIVLRGDCRGILPSFTDPPTTCVDVDHLKGDPKDGVAFDDDAKSKKSLAGTWPGAIERGCVSGAPEGANCIKGGFTMLGEDGFHGIGDGAIVDFDPNPVRPVELDPFFLDVREFTVGRFRKELLEDPSLIDADDMPIPKSTNPLCTFEGLDTDVADARPLNCMIKEDAVRRLCTSIGGDLPSEAQWEHAARGRGQHRAFAWGNEPPDCCHANLQGCAAIPLGENPPDCTGTLDESLDHIHDLTGNLRELTLDRHAPYDSPCWSFIGVPTNPVCEDDSIKGRTLRGGCFEFSANFAHLALRGITDNPHELGFRCAYRDDPR